MSNPYSDLPDYAFWKTGVATTPKPAWPNLFTPKFPIDHTMNIATAGSCFAQHIRTALVAQGIGIFDVEPAPLDMSAELAQRFGFGLQSARYGNIYTARHFLELIEDAISGEVEPRLIWQKEGRFYDALRPNVEPGGLETADEVLALRRAHLAEVLRLLRETDVFIFTLGLTEAWLHSPTGRCLPLAPGLIAGRYTPDEYHLKNFTHSEILKDIKEIRRKVKRINPQLKFLFTVSPVPLTATATDQHVLNASTYSKSTLRSVAGELALRFENIDYFPSYEMITSWAREQSAFEANQRSIKPAAVAEVMALFMQAYNLIPSAPSKQSLQPSPQNNCENGEQGSLDAAEGANELICEEMLLDLGRSGE